MLTKLFCGTSELEIWWGTYKFSGFLVMLHQKFSKICELTFANLTIVNTTTLLSKIGLRCSLRFDELNPNLYEF